MNINTHLNAANDLRRILRVTDTEPGAGHIFERDNGDVLLLVTTPANDPANATYIANIAPLTGTEGVSIVVAEHFVTAPKTKRNPMRRVRIVTGGHAGPATFHPASVLHRRIITWWEGEDDLALVP